MRNIQPKWKSVLHRKAIFLVLGLVAGCGGDGNPFESVPVSGKVVYDDGSPVPLGGVRIYFNSVEPPKDGMHIRPGVVGGTADGSFENVTTHKYADGLVLGKYRVAFVGGAGKVPKEYTEPTKTPLTVEVTESGQFLEIKVLKP
jgi:hypothetical protein